MSAPPYLLQHYYITIVTWNQPIHPSTEKWIKNTWYIYTLEYYSTLRKEWNSSIHSNTDGSVHHCVERNKIGICSQSYVEAKKFDFIEIESRIIDTRGWKGDEIEWWGKYLFINTKLQLDKGNML